MTPAIVVPNLNGEPFIDECLASLRAQTASARVIVVDNGSTDGSVALIRTHYPDVTILELGSNRGFASAANRGISEALRQGADLVALFNNDAVADARWLSALLSAADEHPDAGIVTGRLCTRDGTAIDSAGESYSIWGLPFPRGRGEPAAGRYERGEYVFAATGGASLYRASMLRQIGLFETGFFAYYEDQDLSFRAQLAAWTVWYEPAAVAYHRIGATSSRMKAGFVRYMTIKNAVMLYVRTMPCPLVWRYLPRFLMAMLMLLVVALEQGDAMSAARAVATAVRNLPATIRSRGYIQRSRRVDVAYIDALLYRRLPPTHRRIHRLAQRMRLRAAA